MKRALRLWLGILGGCIVLSMTQWADAAGAPPGSKSAKMAAPQDAPVIQVSEQVFDFGEALEGAEVARDFKVKNAGKADLVIDQVRPSCGCTVASFDRTIPPGKEGKIALKVNLKGFQGNFKKTATIFSNDPQNPRTILTIQGKIKMVVEVRPGTSLNFRGMADQQPEKTVDLVGTIKSFKIVGVESNLEDKVRHQLETIEAGKHYRLKVVNLVKRGNYNGFLKCMTNLPEKPEILIRVSGYLEGEVSVKPMTLLVGQFGAQQPVRSGKVKVVSNLKKPFQIKKLTYDANLITVNQEPLPKEGGFSLSITPKEQSLPPGEEGRQQTTLTIQTDVPSDEPQKVQIHIIKVASSPADASRGKEPRGSDDEEEEVAE